ncbi:ABC transporter ATP-binding protein [Kitasatospora phosalacinea]|uniref:ABC transporter ATP-binding protein n=1 Tax=Kitasatospora phosalacinea TaxID=2065 RepID=A0A9W6V0Y2_9ACTN|nr:ABC transporter ATP-binding protein [Kitasatospora phosalacinea]GLW71374.1 ABC transporter ATP-binding protein [Kitasatospora phosalacinea]
MIEIRDLTKAYGGRRAVDGLSFRVEPGRVTGFLGPNGAGKSTTLRMVLGLDRPTSGTALVDGRPYAALDRPLERVGALLDAQAVHPGRTAAGHLRWIAASHGLPARRTAEVLALVGLAEVADRRIRTFSLGMRQRLGIAAALLGDPAALLLDEPVNGLDAEGIRWIRSLLRRLADEGRAVLVSSHLMAEMALTADHLVVIGRGRLLADTSTADFLAHHGRRRVRVRAVDPAALAALLATAHPDAVPRGDGVFDVPDADPARLGALAAEHRVVLVELSLTHDSLEEAFMRMTADAVEYRAVAA